MTRISSNGAGLLAALLSLAAALSIEPALAQTAPFGMESQQLEGEGWRGFLNVAFLLETVLTLTVAALLGAAIAYHPRSRVAIDTVEEAEAPKTTITYAVVGAVIGLMVLEFGLVVGFVVFGIGGLIRFRTALPSTTETGRLIFVTLIGLSAGLDLPHLAVTATAFGFALIYVLEMRITFSVEVQGLREEDVVESAVQYRAALEDLGCSIVSQKQNLSKGKVSFVFQTSPDNSAADLDRVLETSVPPHLQGTVNWEVA
jgi:hypothetical protein